MSARSLLAALGFPLGFGLLAVLLGKDDNWDLLHYHYYNPHAWLHGRNGHDLLAADFHVYFNPLLDLPFYLGNRHLPGAALTFLLGALHGVNGLLLWRIAGHVLRPGTGVPPLVPALVGMLGAGSIYVVGTTYYDALVALPVFAALWLILRRWDLVQHGPLGRSLPLLVLAGACAGTGVGLKQTVAVFAVGIGVALLLLPGRRIASMVAFGIGGVIGVLATSGFWLWHLWETTGNPLFPYFNHVFRSPLGPAEDLRTRHAMPRDLWEALTWPLVMLRAPWRVDSPVRDAKLLVAYLAVPAGLLLALARPRAENLLAERRIAVFLLVATAVSYLVWLRLFSIYRYLIPVEMLAPLVILAALGFAPLAPRAARILAVALMIAILPIQPSNRDRIAWDGAMGAPFVAAAPPGGMALEGALVVVPGWHPGWRPNAFVIPFFPPEVPFLRIVAHDDPAGRLVTGFDAEIARRIATHPGPVLVLMTPGGEAHVTASLARHNLAAEFAACRRLTTSIGGPLALCPVGRR
ncbi:hypothetical protein DFH01_16220 [Falsiroseomonas bella]|uniref:DUF2029 domain-containing protein n=1 Tax=Falsiroseomonas bella TaxID=2184016 RepID=A0A317FGC3_9PROT|nr:hypothetical protein [Falsiroseomonas bella]PWS36678.1 hypothetical protein DFH01_16220 [Falsiroseomonas bella]